MVYLLEYKLSQRDIILKIIMKYMIENCNLPIDPVPLIIADTVASAFEPLSFLWVPSSVEIAEVIKAYGPLTSSPTLIKTKACQPKHELCIKSPVKPIDKGHLNWLF